MSLTLFVDASAIVALIAPESDAAVVARRLDADPDLLWSAMTRWEAVAALCRSYRYEPSAAMKAIGRLAHEKGFQLVGIGERESEIAIEAYAHYGKGRHPAGLNMGDCFAYACAKASGAALLYKGNDFAKTDLA